MQTAKASMQRKRFSTVTVILSDLWSVLIEREKQIDELAKMTLYRVINGRRCLRSGHCKHCGAHKAVMNPQYEKMRLLPNGGDDL
jgi:hypothetical protein